ncbi:hypothetical protein J6590_040756 [Homalodisca vitripennis]|nr:hypothetical protein J6590_040756 [Homalodisca vitripennis]
MTRLDAVGEAVGHRGGSNFDVGEWQHGSGYRIRDGIREGCQREEVMETVARRLRRSLAYPGLGPGLQHNTREHSTWPLRTDIAPSWKSIYLHRASVNQSVGYLKTINPR